MTAQTEDTESKNYIGQYESVRKLKNLRAVAFSNPIDSSFTENERTQSKGSLASLVNPNNLRILGDLANRFDVTNDEHLLVWADGFVGEKSQDLTEYTDQNADRIVSGIDSSRITRILSNKDDTRVILPYIDQEEVQKLSAIASIEDKLRKYEGGQIDKEDIESARNTLLNQTLAGAKERIDKVVKHASVRDMYLRAARQSVKTNTKELIEALKTEANEALKKAKKEYGYDGLVDNVRKALSKSLNSLETREQAKDTVYRLLKG